MAKLPLMLIAAKPRDDDRILYRAFHWQVLGTRIQYHPGLVDAQILSITDKPLHSPRPHYDVFIEIEESDFVVINASEDWWEDKDRALQMHD